MEIFIAYWKFKNRIHLFKTVHDKRPLCNMTTFTSISGDADLKEFLSQADPKNQVCKVCRRRATELLNKQKTKK